MKRVLTYGTFDTLHYGHIRLLQRARALGDYLIVALSTDEFNAIKGKKAYHSWEERKAHLEALRYVDLVIPENTWEQKRQDVTLYHVDIFTMGSDWEGKFDFLSDLCTVTYLSRTEGISSTMIRNTMDASEPAATPSETALSPGA
ncbi:glycerol-3-phosphate cytidylyltransferase [Gemmobacter lanyuensis]|nr:glycerol-3-phosphate cytidylyltransferase [Gemmobacter lanyuensis]